MTKDVDSADRALLLRAMAVTVPAAVSMSGAVAFYLRETRHVGGVTLAGVVALGALVGIGAGYLSWWSAERTGRGLAHVLLSAGNLPPAASFSYQESLVARGRYQEAVDAFEAHLALNPEDQDARLAMAGILAGPLKQTEAAVQLYQTVRIGPSPGYDLRASQALIDLHRATGDRGRLMAELARFADRFRGTRAGRAAKHALAALKEER